MKTRVLFLILILAQSLYLCKLSAQSLQVTPELKELIRLSVNKDRKVAAKDFDKQITTVQRKAVRSSYLPKLEVGGKYVYAYSTIDSEIGDIEGFEAIGDLQEFMKNPLFALMFPSLAGITSEITQLEQLMAQQGMSIPSLSKNIEGSFSGNYFGLDATATMLLYSGGQVPNISKALNEKIKVEDALSDKCKSDVIRELITYYDQLALINQSKQVLDESVIRLAAEKKYATVALENGFATSFDTLKIAVADAYLQSKLSEYKSKKKLLHNKLSQLTGKPASFFAYTAPKLEMLLYIDTTGDISNRPELRALSAGVEAQKYMLKSEKSHYLPKVQALASVRYDNVFNANTNLDSPLPMEMGINNITLGPTYMVGAGFKWEIFDRSGGSAKVKKAKIEVMKAENAREDARELLELNEIKVMTNYKSSIMQVTYKDKQKQAARMALELAQKSYNQGVINITERLATETEMQNAELEYINAVFAQRQAVLDCYNANGNLTLENIK